MKFCLETVVINPENNVEIKNAVILLHGYGGDGKDISILTLNWKRFMPNTVFLCPNAHEKCEINPNGYQWFDLSKENQEYILDQSLKAEKKLKEFIDQVKTVYGLDNSKICLSGFSQGCMLAINIGLIENEPFSCVVGFSGKIINKNNLASRIISKTKFLLLHGDMDQVVSPSNLLEAKDFLERNKIEVETNMLQNCEHHISTEASSFALKYIKKNLGY
jgi:phospholipase/carboxylesterase